MANTTWNPSDKSANITLSGTNNLTATSTNGLTGCVRAIDKQITGKFYWEITTTTVAGSGILGALSGSFGLGNGWSTAGNIGCCGCANTGLIFVDGVSTGINMGGYTSGSVVCFAFDVGNRLAWFRLGAAGNWNGSATANPATGTGGIACTLGDGIPLYPAIESVGTGNVSTANFGDMAFTGTVPSGFTSGFTSGVTTPTNAIATQVAVEHWLRTTAPAQVTQVAVEQWASVAATYPTPTTPSVVLSASRAGIGSVVLNQDNVTRTELVADIGVVPQIGTVIPLTASLSDTIVSSDSFTESAPDLAVLTDSIASSDLVSVTFGYSKVLSDNVSSSDAFSEAEVFVLTDTLASSDSFYIPINYPASLSDSIVSSDVVAITAFGYWVSLADTIISSDRLSLLSDFLRTLADSVSYFDQFNGVLTIGPSLECGPIPLFPPLPQGFPIKLSIVMDTTLGTTKSLREMRVAQQQYPLWDIELLFEELVDQTQNQVPYGPFIAIEQYETLVGLWLSMYGQTNLFAFDAPWDDSRSNQVIGTGDGTTVDFVVFRTWGQGSLATAAPVGLIGNVLQVTVGGTVVAPNQYSLTRSQIHFFNPPANGAIIAMTFSFYYVCRFVEDEQDFEEFSKNRWTVPSLKFRAVYWPGCS